jgi:hypothetical protein
VDLPLKVREAHGAGIGVGVRESLPALTKKPPFILHLQKQDISRTESTLRDKFRALPSSKARKLHAVTTGIHP